MLLGLVYVLLTGILSIQAIGARAGAVFDLNNELVAVTSPRIPVVPMLATALLSGLVFYAVAVVIQKRAIGVRISTVAGFTVAVIALIIWSFTITPDGAPRGVGPVGVAVGWEGWIQKGGTNPAVHLVVVLALGALWPFRSTSSNVSGSGQDGEPNQ